MIHYSCDRCGRKIDPAQEMRYEVKIEVEPVLEVCEEDEREADRDHLSEIHESLDGLDFDDEFAMEPRQRLRFDLCPHCFRRYQADPLGADSMPHFGFSHN